MRAYQPTTLPRLADAVNSGCPPREEVVVAASESEEDEYAALMTAADLSAALADGLPDGQRRRVVVVREAGEDEVLAVHADPVDDADPDDDLAWYATQEIDSLLDF